MNTLIFFPSCGCHSRVMVTATTFLSPKRVSGKWKIHCSPSVALNHFLWFTLPLSWGRFGIKFVVAVRALAGMLPEPIKLYLGPRVSCWIRIFDIENLLRFSARITLRSLTALPVFVFCSACSGDDDGRINIRRFSLLTLTLLLGKRSDEGTLRLVLGSKATRL